MERGFRHTVSEIITYAQYAAGWVIYQKYMGIDTAVHESRFAQGNN